MAPPPARAAIVAGGCAALIAVVYVLAFDTASGVSFDERALLVPGLEDVRPGSPAVLVFSAPWLAGAASLGLLALAVGAQALRRGGPRAVVAAGSIVAAALVSAELAKWLLAEAGPAGDSDHGTAASFPSAHAAAGMSLGLGLVALAPARLRAAAVALAVAYPLAIGVLAMLEGWHYPSDVIAGNLLGAAWLLIGGAALARSAEGGGGRDTPLGRHIPLRAIAIAGVAGSVAAVAAGLIVSAARWVPDWIHAGPFLAGAAAVAGSAAAAVLLARATAP